MPDGLYDKYTIKKVDGSVVDPDALYFVLRIDTDEHAREALRAYINSLEESRENSALADDLRDMLKPWGGVRND